MTCRWLFFTLLTQILGGQQLPDNQRNFIACPVVRDTNTVPCWLAEYEGELYYLGVQPEPGTDWQAPQQGHELLVEGTVKGGPRLCGGIPLSPVSISVLPELNRACNTVLAKDEIEAPLAYNNAEPVSAEPPFVVYFNFDNDRISSRGMQTIERAVAYLKVRHSDRVEVNVFRGSALLSDGRTLAENEVIPARRARKIIAVLQAQGIQPSAVSVEIESIAVKPDGLTDPDSRRAVLSIAP